MYLSGLVHRDRLFDVASRWIADRIAPGDGLTVSEVFAFERSITAPVVRNLVAELCRSIHDDELYLERATTKDQVREAIVTAAGPHPTVRVEELIDWYKQIREQFFPRTPVQMSIVTRRSGRLAAMVRRKRIRRIADKVSRQITAQLAGEIDAVARSLAASRPPGSKLDHGTAEEEVLRFRAAAERLVAERIHAGRIALNPDRLRVDDVIGVKIIGREAELARVEAALDNRDDVFVCEREVHEGRYCGTHLLVDVELPPPGWILDRMDGVDWTFAAGRGLPSDEIPGRFQGYVESASPRFRVEMILTTFEDLVESEFGSCIHEHRILAQRDLASEFGFIAQNASAIMEFMLSLAISPTVEIEELPIKVWGRYVRDTVAHAIACLDGVDPSEWVVPDEHQPDLVAL
jgi:hypothetical protein